MIFFLILSLLLGLVSLVTFLIVNSGNVNARNKKAIMYLLLFSFIIWVFGLTGFMHYLNKSFYFFVVLQIVFILIGYLYAILLKKEKFGEFQKPELSNALLIIANTAFGAAGFGMVFNSFNDVGMGNVYATSVITFSIPYFFVYTFNILASIPLEIYTVWKYPLNAPEADFDNIDTSKLYLVEIEFSKTTNDANITNYKVKAPFGMKFGEWYRSFIDNYNYKFEEAPIQHLNNNQQPYGWIFFIKPTFWTGNRYIDASKTIVENKINEKTIIVAKRVEVEDDNDGYIN